MHKRACKHCKEELIKVKKIIIVSCKKRILTEIFYVFYMSIMHSFSVMSKHEVIRSDRNSGLNTKTGV